MGARRRGGGPESAPGRSRSWARIVAPGGPGLNGNFGAGAAGPRGIGIAPGRLLACRIFVLPIPLLLAVGCASGLYALLAGMSLSEWFHYLEDPADPGGWGLFVTCQLVSFLCCLGLAWGCLVAARARLGRMLNCPEAT